jgi:hypothetical protein
MNGTPEPGTFEVEMAIKILKKTQIARCWSNPGRID